MNEEKSGQAQEELDLQAILKKAEQVTDFPDVPLDEFTPPTYDEWKEACIALLKGAPFEKKMYTKTYEGLHFLQCISGRILTLSCQRNPSLAWMIL